MTAAQPYGHFCVNCYAGGAIFGKICAEESGFAETKIDAPLGQSSRSAFPKYGLVTGLFPNAARASGLPHHDFAGMRGRDCVDQGPPHCP